MKKILILIFFVLINSIVLGTPSDSHRVEKITGYLYLEGGILFTFYHATGDANMPGGNSVSITGKNGEVIAEFNFPQYQLQVEDKKHVLIYNNLNYDIIILPTVDQTFNRLIKKYPLLKKSISISYGNGASQQNLQSIGLRYVGLHINKNGRANLYIQDYGKKIARSDTIFSLKVNSYGHPNPLAWKSPYPINKPSGLSRQYSFYSAYEVKRNSPEKIKSAIQKGQRLPRFTLKATLIRYRILVFDWDIFVEKTKKQIIRTDMGGYYQANIQRIKSSTRILINKTIVDLFLKAAAYYNKRGQKKIAGNHTALGYCFQKYNAISRIRIQRAQAKELNSRGMGFYRLKQYNKAFLLFKQAAAIWPEYYWGVFNTACLSAKLGKTESALEYFKLSITLWKGHRKNPHLDTDFNELRNNQEFKKLIKLQIKKQNVFYGERK